METDSFRSKKSTKKYPGTPLKAGKRLKTPLLGYFSKKATAAVPNYMSCTREEKQYIYFVVRHTKENARKERGGGGRGEEREGGSGQRRTSQKTDLLICKGSFTSKNPELKGQIN